MIKIVGLGPGAPEALTIGAVKTLEESNNLFFRTEKHPTVDYLRSRLNGFKTCDNYYESGNSFDEVYQNIANDIIEEYKKTNELVYAVPGHPLVAERSASAPSTALVNACSPPAMRPTTIPGSTPKVGGHSEASSTPNLPLVPAPI